MISDETRAKMRAAKLGKPGNPSAIRGKKLPPEWRASMSEGQKRRMKRSGERERLAELARSPEQRARQRQIAIALASRPERVSKLEETVAQALIGRGFKFTRQFSNGHFAFDFAFPGKMVLLEVDGCYWHGCELCGYPGVPKTVHLDKAKNGWAKANGWKLIRLAEHNVTERSMKELEIL